MLMLVVSVNVFLISSLIPQRELSLEEWLQTSIAVESLGDFQKTVFSDFCYCLCLFFKYRCQYMLVVWHLL